MNYHDITKVDMRNGDGLRVVLWVSGCSHHCHNCQNPVTWDPEDGLLFDGNAFHELVDALDHDYISGLTLSGGDPLHPSNIYNVGKLLQKLDLRNKGKTVWLYTGYTWEELMKDDWLVVRSVLFDIDVLVDGKFVQKLADVKYHWAGSTNQRVIDVQKSLQTGKVILYG